jgi:hypothetical protein
MDAPTQNILGVGMGLGLFLLAMIYSLADISTVFDKNAFVGKYTNSIKYALAFFFGFVTIVFKIMLVLLFIFMFIVVCNIVVVGVFKPLMSESLLNTSNPLSAVKGFIGAREIIEQARVSYFSMIKTVAVNTMQVVFGFINIPNTIILLFTVIPLYLLFSTFSYYQFVSNKGTISNDSQKEQKILNTNYHYFIILIFTILVTFAIYIVSKTLMMLSNKTLS